MERAGKLRSLFTNLKDCRRLNLRREIALIQQEEERSYRGHGIHSPLDRAEHAEREGRVVVIRDELKRLWKR